MNGCCKKEETGEKGEMMRELCGKTGTGGEAAGGQGGLSRRHFLKAVAIGGMSAIGTGFAGCRKDEKNAEPTGSMTMRTNPKSGEKVSLLGFGMMRLPSVGGRSAREGNEPIDQDMVNRMVDYYIVRQIRLALNCLLTLGQEGIFNVLKLPFPTKNDSFTVYLL